MVTNGAIPDSQLVHGIQGWAKLWPSTAAKFALFEADLLAATGIRPIITRDDQGLTDIGAYRTYAQQVRAKQLLGSRAAAPGYSNHGFGQAFDVYNIGRYNQATIDAVAARHGLVRDGYVGGRAESWHYHDADGVMPAGSNKTPITPIQEEDDMPIVIKADPAAPSFGYIFAGWNYVQEPSGIIRPVGSDAEFNLLVALGAKVVTWKAQDIYTLLASKFGFRGFEGDATRGVVKLTGQIIYAA